MQLNYMREFLAFAEYGSITGAAEALDMSQPVLSKHLQAIESEIDAELFIRTKKGLKPTPVGERALSTFSEIISLYDRFIIETHMTDSSVSGQLRIGVISAGANRYVVPCVNRFLERYPNITCTYRTETSESALGHLLDRSIDLTFRAHRRDDSNGQISYLHIADDPIRFIVLANSPLAQKESIDPKDVADKTLLCLPLPESTQTLNALTFDAGYIPKRIQRVDVIEVVVSALVKTGGYFIAPDFMCRLFSSPIVKICTPSVPLTQGIYFAYRTKDRNPLVSLFLENVTQQIL